MQRRHRYFLQVCLAALAAQVVLFCIELRSTGFLGVSVQPSACLRSRYRQPGKTLREAAKLADLPMPYGKVSLEGSLIEYRFMIPRVYNWCKSLGMNKGKIMPSVGFCSDENQGFAAVLILKHFGAYPFSHAYIGGQLALDRHGPHAAHGKDVVIFHASHVGYDTEVMTYGSYRRAQVEDQTNAMSTCCGKVAGILAPYKQQHARMLSEIRLKEDGDRVLVSFVNTAIVNLHEEGQREGIELIIEHLIKGSLDEPIGSTSTRRTYVASDEITELFKNALSEQAKTKKQKEDPSLDARNQEWWRLDHPDLKGILTGKHYKFVKFGLDGESNRLERILLPHMPEILSSGDGPEFTGAVIIAQSEFNRAVHSVAAEPAYADKNLVLISGINVDISLTSQEDVTAFPTTMFLPWAAYVQTSDGERVVVEQEDLIQALMSSSVANEDEIDIEGSILGLATRRVRRIAFYDSSRKQVKFAVNAKPIAH
jgi:hypothetical protein